MKSRRTAYLACGWLLVAGVVSAQQTNYYYFNREFIPCTISGGAPTTYKIIMGARELTGIVGPTNICIISNETKATEFDVVGLGYGSSEEAWSSVVDAYSSCPSNHLGMTFDNVGFVKLTHEAYGDWGSFLWYLQNTIAFTSSASSVYVSPAGVTSAIASVLLGTIGDFCPQTVVVDVGPVLDTNYPGAGIATNYVARADLSAYYKLVPSSWFGVNDDDSDGDGIPDFADGYNWDGQGGSPDDLSTNDYFTPWPVLLSGYAEPTQAMVNISYNASDPSGVTVGTNGYVPASGYFRLWRTQAGQARNGASILSGGDYIPPGTYAATSLGFSVSARLVDFYVEPIAPGTNQTIIIEVDPDGSGPKGFVCVDRQICSFLSVDFLDASKSPVSTLKVGKWENAFANETVKDNFIDLDPDRFYVRVNDQSKKGSGRVSVSLSTDSDGSDYDDDATEIELSEEPANSGIFFSTNMLLVSDEVDDDFTNICVVADDTGNDRTHKIALGGTGAVQYPATGAVLCVRDAGVPPSLKAVEVNLIILRDKPQSQGGQPVISTDSVEAQWRASQERYAQVGVRVNWNEPVINDPPTNVDLLTDGLCVREYYSSSNIADEAKFVISELRTQPDITDIHVFYVNYCVAGTRPLYGAAIADCTYDEADEAYLYNIFISTNAQILMPAHELGHLLADAFYGTSVPLENLLYDGTNINYNNTNATDGKRINVEQENRILTNSHVYDP